MMNPQYPVQRPQGPSPNLGVISLALGIIGFVTLLPMLIFTFCAVVPFFSGIAAAIVGILGFFRAKNSPEKYSGKGLSMAGAVLGVISVLLPLLWAAVIVGYIIYVGTDKPGPRFF